MSLEMLGDATARCSMTHQYTYALLWRPESQRVPGTRMEIRSHCTRAFLGWRYTRIEVRGADVEFRWKSNPTVSEVWRNPTRTIVRARLQYGARRGDPVEILLTVIPPSSADVFNLLSVWTQDVPSNLDPSAPDPAAVVEKGSELRLEVRAGPVERVSVTSRPMPNSAGKVRTCLVPEDRFGNPSSFDGPVTGVLGWEGGEQEVEIRHPRIVELGAPRRVGRASLAVPMSRLGPAENVSNGARRGGDLVVQGNPVWAREAGGEVAAFGEFHWHTEFSGDGERPIEDALRSARDDMNLDFCAPGDHNPRGAAWQRTVSALEAANADGDFATFFGWENGSSRGHENYYFTEPDHPLVCGGSAGITSGNPDALADDLERLAEELDFLVVPHHSNAVAASRKLEDDSPYWHPYPWTGPRRHIRLVEIMQIRGNQERNVYDDAWRGWHQRNGSSAQDALAIGHRIGFTGGTDNHCGWPGRVNADSEGKGMYGSKGEILTGLWTITVERRAVFGALKARHTWAVWDTRALVRFSINGAAAGDELEVAPGTELRMKLRLSAEDALQTVEIVSAGEIVWQRSFEEPDVELDEPIGRAERSTHFYLRALQRNGGIIYASPVFVDVRST